MSTILQIIRNIWILEQDQDSLHQGLAVVWCWACHQVRTCNMQNQKTLSPTVIYLTNVFFLTSPGGRDKTHLRGKDAWKESTSEYKLFYLPVFIFSCFLRHGIFLYYDTYVYRTWYAFWMYHLQHSCVVTRKEEQLQEIMCGAARIFH